MASIVEPLETLDRANDASESDEYFEVVGTETMALG